MSSSTLAVLLSIDDIAWRAEFIVPVEMAGGAAVVYKILHIHYFLIHTANKNAHTSDVDKVLRLFLTGTTATCCPVLLLLIREIPRGYPFSA